MTSKPLELHDEAYLVSYSDQDWFLSNISLQGDGMTS